MDIPGTRSGLTSDVTPKSYAAPPPRHSASTFAPPDDLLVLPHPTRLESSSVDSDVIAPSSSTPSSPTPSSLAPRLPFPRAELPGHSADSIRFGGNGFPRVRLALFDLLAIVLTFICLTFVMLGEFSATKRLLVGTVATVTTLGAMRLTGLYRSRQCVHGSNEFAKIGLCVLTGAAALAGAQYRLGMTGAQAIPIGAACLSLLLIFRWHYRRWLRDRRAVGMYLRRVVLVGTNEDAAMLLEMLRAEPELGFDVTAVIGDLAPDAFEPSLPRASSVGSVAELARTTGSNGVLIVPSALSSADVHHAINCAAIARLHVQIWPGIAGVASRRLRQVPVSGEPFFYVEPWFARPWHKVVKRSMDVVGSFAALAVSAPLLAAAACLIKLDDHGPVFHRQKRIGLDGRAFVIYKLRTMTVKHEMTSLNLADLNERVDGPLFKSARDPRVTRIGRYLRASSIDELPQLWNVLSGSMSLVGPRPALPEETAQFDVDLLRRLTVRPGLTGLWQIEARDNPSFNAYRRLDLHYVDNWSLLLDLNILLSTPPVVLSHALRALRRRQHR